MSDPSDTPPAGTAVTVSWRLTLVELCRACDTNVEQVVTLVHEGVILPEGRDPDDWRFDDACLRRARRAVRLARDLEINPPGVALALDLLDEIDALQARLQGRHV